MKASALQDEQERLDTLQRYETQQAERQRLLQQQQLDTQTNKEQMPEDRDSFFALFPDATDKDYSTYRESWDVLGEQEKKTTAVLMHIEQELALCADLKQKHQGSKDTESHLQEMVKETTMLAWELATLQQDQLVAKKETYKQVLNDVQKKMTTLDTHLARVQELLAELKKFGDLHADHPALVYVQDRMTSMQMQTTTLTSMMKKTTDIYQQKIDLTFAQEIQQYKQLQKSIIQELFACHELDEDEVVHHYQENTDLLPRLKTLATTLSVRWREDDTARLSSLLQEQYYIHHIIESLWKKPLTTTNQSSVTDDFLQAFIVAEHEARPIEISETLWTHIAWIHHIQTYGCVLFTEGVASVVYYYGKIYVVQGPYIQAYTPQELFSAQEIVLDDFAGQEITLNWGSKELQRHLSLEKQALIQQIQTYVQSYQGQDVSLLKNIDFMPLAQTMREVFNISDYSFYQILTGLTYIFGQDTESEEIGRSYMASLAKVLVDDALPWRKYDGQFQRLVEYIAEGGKREEFEITSWPPEWLLRHQTKITWWKDRQKTNEQQKYQIVLDRVTELTEQGIVTYGEHAGKQEMIDTITGTAFNLAPMSSSSWAE